MSALSSAELLFPLRDCEPWCDSSGNDNSHADLHPDDRSCWSEYNVLPLSQHKPVLLVEGQWRMDSLDVFLRRRPTDVEPVIYLHDEGTDSEVVMTLSEAGALMTALNRLLETADPSVRKPKED